VAPLGRWAGRQAGACLAVRYLPCRCRASDNDTVGGGAEIVSFGPDPVRPSWWRVHRRLVAVAAVLALICAMIRLGLVLSGQPQPTAARQAQTITAMLRGAPLRPDPRLGTLVLGGGTELRLVNVSNLVPSTLDWAHGLPGGSGRRSLGPRARVQQIVSVSGGVAVLLSDDAQMGDPATGEVFFVPVTSRGAGKSRLIARANYLAVALNQRDIWVEQAGARLGRGPGRAWLVNESGRTLSAALDLHGQVLLAATVRGLLTQGPSGEGARLTSPAGGMSRAAGIPRDALVVAAGPDDVAWEAASCGGRCLLHITSLRDGTDTVIRLPLHTLPDTSYPLRSAFDLAGLRLALVMETANGEDRATGTSVYAADVGRPRLIRLPGGPIPLWALSAVGADRDASPALVSVRWAGSGLWIVASNGEDSQAAYWAGVGPLHVTALLAGSAYTFNVASDFNAGRDATATASR
jgi:hypothetical protein